MRIEMPEDVREIIRKLKNSGYEAFAVGGCVRDALLNRTPMDWDITTNALPREVKKLFRRTVDTGIKHGTVTIMMGASGYEVTTYRIDGDYKDGRHPEAVTFTRSLEEDLKRRDFTINAMAYNEDEGLIDLFSGQEDLKMHIIRAVGDPCARFSEDALRILRCIRFCAQLDFCPEENTLKAAEALSSRLQYISEERIREELLKTLMSDHPEKVQAYEKIGAMRFIFPGFSEGADLRLQKLSSIRKDLILRLSAFLYGLDKEEVEKVLKNLKFDNDTLKRTCRLLEFDKKEMPEDDRGLRHLMAAYGTEDIFRLLEFKERPDLMEKTDNILKRGECVSLKMLDITGKDLIEKGMKPGKDLGDMLNTLLEIVLDNPEMNRKNLLLECAELAKSNPKNR